MMDDTWKPKANIWHRLHYAIHVLRGRPLVYGMDIIGGLHVAAGHWHTPTLIVYNRFSAPETQQPPPAWWRRALHRLADLGLRT